MKRKIIVFLLALALALPTTAQSVLIDGARLSILADDAAADTTVTFDLNLSPGGTGGVVYFTFSAAGYAGATVTVDAGPDTVQLVNVLAATTLVNVSTTQRFRVDSFAAAVLRITYTTGGATAVTYDLAFGYGGDFTVVAGVDGTTLQTLSVGSNGVLNWVNQNGGLSLPSGVLNNADGAVAGNRITGRTIHLFNGTTFDRLRSADATTLTDTISTGVQLVAPLSTWAVTHGPGAATVATATRAAGAAGVRHVCTSIVATLHNGGGTFDGRKVRLRDGVSGAGTILWEGRLGVAVTDGETDHIAISGLAIIGTAATAMTLEFDSAPSANNFETVSFTGYSVQ